MSEIMVKRLQRARGELIAALAPKKYSLSQAEGIPGTPPDSP